MLNYLSKSIFAIFILFSVSTFADNQTGQLLYDRGNSSFASGTAQVQARSYSAALNSFKEAQAYFAASQNEYSYSGNGGSASVAGERASQSSIMVTITMGYIKGKPQNESNE